MSVAEWTTASLYQIGFTYETFTKSLLNSPPPSSLSKDDQELYKQQIDEFVVPIEERALEAYESGWKKALELGIFNSWTAKMREALGRLELRALSAAQGDRLRAPEQGPFAAAAADRRHAPHQGQPQRDLPRPGARAARKEGREEGREEGQGKKKSDKKDKDNDKKADEDKKADGSWRTTEDETKPAAEEPAKPEARQGQVEATGQGRQEGAARNDAPACPAVSSSRLRSRCSSLACGGTQKPERAPVLTPANPRPSARWLRRCRAPTRSRSPSAPA